MNKKNRAPIKIVLIILTIAANGLFATNTVKAEHSLSQSIPDTGQTQCFNDKRIIAYPDNGSAFHGQDAQYETRPMTYQDNKDGTVTDLVSGLIWSKAVDKTKVSLIQAHNIAKNMTLGGHTDWRVPNIKELYSLINFSGNTGSAGKGSLSGAIPFINTDYFDFRYGDTTTGERYIDAQWLSSTQYVATTMNGAATLFGVNFADGRIKGYGYSRPHSSRPEKKFFARYVRGNAYGLSEFKDNNDGTISDKATGLMWMRSDSGKGMNWKEALAYAENSSFAGFNDWRLPNAKELQYLVDYKRSPDTTDSAAIDPIFETSTIENESHHKDYPYFWSSTTHQEGSHPGAQGAYVSFGRGMGQMRSQNMDVHGAGAQRSDPKSGEGNFSRGPQGDWIRVNNYVRLVRGGSVTKKTNAPVVDKNKYPFKLNIENLSAVSDVQPSMNSGQQGMQRPNNQNDTQNHAQRFINRLDRDGDKRISSVEFDGPARHFSQFDRNNDGYISMDEAPTGQKKKKRKIQQ